MLLMAWAGTTPAYGQIPEKFENLKVLPKDISRAELVSTMRGFTNALGARCQYCHVYRDGTSPDDLANYDFESDDKPAKDKARFMMRMAAAINDTILPRIGKRAAPAIGVTCYTCHRGSPLPRTLEAVLAQTFEAQGIDSTVAQYRHLRATVMPLGRYNFAERTLNDYARQLMAAGEAHAAIRILELNQEHHPHSANIDFQIGEIHRGLGEREQAILRYRQALKKAPGHGPATQRLTDLKAL